MHNTIIRSVMTMATLRCSRALLRWVERHEFNSVTSDHWSVSAAR